MNWREYGASIELGISLLSLSLSLSLSASACDNERDITLYGVLNESGVFVTHLPSQYWSHPHSDSYTTVPDTLGTPPGEPGREYISGQLTKLHCPVVMFHNVCSWI